MLYRHSREDSVSGAIISICVCTLAELIIAWMEKLIAWPLGPIDELIILRSLTYFTYGVSCGKEIALVRG